MGEREVVEIHTPAELCARVRQPVEIDLRGVSFLSRSVVQELLIPLGQGAPVRILVDGGSHPDRLLTTLFPPAYCRTLGSRSDMAPRQWVLELDFRPRELRGW